ncbi:MAG: PAS domain S-box-containing protein [Rhodoferax sp.]|jgi:PAS domain S-box-containing protein
MATPALSRHAVKIAMLRKAAETQFAGALKSSPPAHPSERLLHELQVHQIELEMQNEELRQVQIDLEESRARYVDLYEFAPVGYLTLTGEGRILEINLTCATLLDLDRKKLVNSAFSQYVAPEDGDRWYRFFRHALQQINRQSCELALQRHDRSRFHARLDCVCPSAESSVLRVTVTDISEHKAAEEMLRIAAAAFECQGGMVVMNAHMIILRVNSAFMQITGYTQQEVQQKTTNFLRSAQHNGIFYDGVRRELQRTGAWQGDLWLRRRNSEDVLVQAAVTAVLNAQGQLTHYVGHLTDATNRQLLEQQRLRNEATHRNTLVHEVHHRIKNNLQGITGLLRQFAQKHPETSDFIKEAIGQVQGISVIHGLQGGTDTASVLLCELSSAIAKEIQSLWQTPITLKRSDHWQPCVIAEKEAVPLALVLNELILNAVKHGGQAHGQVSIHLQKGATPGGVQIKILNTGQLVPPTASIQAPHHGLDLITALMPRNGASLVREQLGAQVMTLLVLEPPVIFIPLKEHR